MTVTAEELKEMVFDELESLGFTFDEKGDLIPPTSKEAIIKLHEPSRKLALRKAQKWIRKKLPLYSHFFADGQDISPLAIKPILIQVTEEWQSDLFRLARYYWSLPYSFGFGRRLRYLLLDENNGKLIGIFGLQSSPISFPARDILFNYPKGRKTELVNQTMDIFTLGALPPYNRLLGGKLVALSVASNEVRQDYERRYKNCVTEMEKRVLPANLIALTTTSAYGRSSIYNRLKFKGTPIAISLGYTSGYGNFHLQKLYPIFKQFLKDQNISCDGGYGTGPRRSWQIIRRTLDKVGIEGDFLKHGIKREAFLFPLVSNLKKFLEASTDIPIYRDLPFENLAEYWKERWLTNRYKRVDGWHKWESKAIANSLLLNNSDNEE